MKLRFSTRAVSLAAGLTFLVSAQALANSLSEDQRAAKLLAAVPITASGSLVSSLHLPTPRVAAGAPAILDSFVSASALMPGLPCWSCVGAPPLALSLGLGVPSPFIPPAPANLEITLAFEDASYVGPATVKYVVVAPNNFVVANGANNVILRPDFFVWGFPVARPAFHGPAVLYAAVIPRAGPVANIVTEQLFF